MEAELQRLQTIIKDSEKANKKLLETHKKEMKELERRKTDAEENLNSAVQENTKIKEKEDTMHQILKGLQKLLERYENDPVKKDQVNNVSVTPDVDDSTGGARAKGPIFSCQKCPFTTTNITHLNKHTRNEHISTLFPCTKCDQQTNDLI